MKKKIVIASLLKPTDDVRSFWKLSQSMAKTNKYEVNIIGNGGKKQSNEKNITFIPHSVKRNNWIRRILIREVILYRILKIKPALLVITTHELINVALIAKLLLKCKVVYDVQENYKQNLSYLGSSWIHTLLASMIRWKENISRLFVDEYWLAEKCYKDELPFTLGKFSILENKAFAYQPSVRVESNIHLLFSGTISEYGGIKRAVSIFEHLGKVEASTTLTVIGQIHDKELHSWLEAKGQTTDKLVLQLSENAIPYETILNAISEANLGVISYEPNAVNQNKLPTKLYEYSRYQLPYLVQENTIWSREGKRLGGAISVNFDHLNSAELFKKIKNMATNFPNTYPHEATWETESKQMLTSLNNLID